MSESSPFGGAREAFGLNCGFSPPDDVGDASFSFAVLSWSFLLASAGAVVAGAPLSECPAPWKSVGGDDWAGEAVAPSPEYSPSTDLRATASSPFGPAYLASSCGASLFKSKPNYMHFSV